ncbi:hydrolase [Alkalihalobacillus pseudalcaliphilus]|nr:hydrolase [Alkalihalobacillus pseudalcaliphilus]
MSIVFLMIFGMIVLIISFSYMNHQIQLSREDEWLKPIGDFVEVNGHNMHVYTEGTGEKTLVFMSGGGTSSPVLDFKTLYTMLSDQYKIVVVEKAGYGFSEITDSNRDIDTILSETREALIKSEVEGPYILFPHSMSGIEALYWAQLYPKEVEAIVGLDMAVPAVYEDLNIPITVIRLGEMAANMGLTRWVPNLSVSEALKHDILTEEESDLYQTILYRRTSTKNMVNEVSQIKENAKRVEKEQLPNVPMLLFSSNGQGTGWDERSWIDFQEEFIRRHGNSKLIKYNSTHYIHHINFEEIAEESKEFINGL